MTDFAPVPARSRRLRPILTGALLFAAVVEHAGAGVVTYTELFTNPSPATAKNFGSIGWNAHIGAGAVDFTNTTAVASTDPAVIWTTAGQGSGGPSYGFSSSITAGGLFWTTEIGSIQQESIESIGFWSNNTNTTATLRLAIRMDNNTPADFADDLWFATSTAFIRNVGAEAGTSGNWATNGEFELFNFTKSAAAWRDLTFIPGATLSLASGARTQDLPAGNVNAVGIYGSGSGLRFDTFEVTSIPEPSSLLLSAGALAGVMAMRRRRR